jgi:hypothetical protein
MLLYTLTGECGQGDWENTEEAKFLRRTLPNTSLPKSPTPLMEDCRFDPSVSTFAALLNFPGLNESPGAGGSNPQGLQDEGLVEVEDSLIYFSNFSTPPKLPVPSPFLCKLQMNAQRETYSMLSPWEQPGCRARKGCDQISFCYPDNTRETTGDSRLSRDFY